MVRELSALFQVLRQKKLDFKKIQMGGKILLFRIFSVLIITVYLLTVLEFFFILSHILLHDMAWCRQVEGGAISVLTEIHLGRSDEEEAKIKDSRGEIDQSVSLPYKLHF